MPSEAEAETNRKTESTKSIANPIEFTAEVSFEIFCPRYLAVTSVHRAMELKQNRPDRETVIIAAQNK